MGTRNNPGRYDCYANALPDEPMFVLLARDPDAAYIVRLWAGMRSRRIKEGQRPEGDEALVNEATECADNMERWRAENDGAWRKLGAAP